jgi:hypothetical protein
MAGAAWTWSGAPRLLRSHPWNETPSKPDRAGDLLWKLTSPILFPGDARTAYRDPAAVYHQGWFYLFFTLTTVAPNGTPFLTVASRKSRDLRSWSPLHVLTAQDTRLNYSSPGDVVRHGDRWIMCLQTYPRPEGQRYADASARLWTCSSRDLTHWSDLRLLRVKGPDVPLETMGRMIDPFLVEDKDVPGRWWCFYKQDGISISSSIDLSHWTPFGKTAAGENPCVIVDGHDYVLFHSPPNGIGTKRSNDLLNWKDEGITTLGQDHWPWAQGRITAGFVLDLRKTPAVGKALMFFHGSQFPEDDPRGGFDNYASIGVAWSDDLKTWEWPGSRE